MRAGAWPAYSEARDPSAISAGAFSPPSAADPHEVAHACSHLSTAGPPLMRCASQNGDDAGPLAATPRRAPVRTVLLVVTVMCLPILVARPAGRRPPLLAAEQERRRPDAVAVAVDSEPAGAEILRDGRVLGVTPFRGTLPRREDDVMLVIRKAGYIENVVVAHRSHSLRKHVVLVPRPAS